MAPLRPRMEQGSASVGYIHRPTLPLHSCPQLPSHHYPIHTSLKLRVDSQKPAPILIIHTLQRCPGQSIHIVLLLSRYLESAFVAEADKGCLHFLGRSKGSTITRHQLSLFDGVCTARLTFSNIITVNQPDGIGCHYTHQLRRI